MKKILICLILVCSILIVIKFRFSNYTIEYKVNDYDIKTVYKNKRFYYEIKNGDTIFNFDIYSKRGFGYTKIEKIDEIIEDNLYCVIPSIKDTKTYPLCYLDGVFTDYNIIDIESLIEYKEYSVDVEKANKDFTFYNNLNKDEYVALWNYKGYIIMNGNSYQNIELFNRDKYDNTLAHIYKDTIYMANNDEEHEYSSLITLNIVTQKKGKIDLGYNIDYDSYIVGNVENKLYIFDNKYSILYEVNLKNGNVEIKGNNEKGYTKYEGGKFVTCSKNDYKINKIKYNNTSSNYEYKYDEVTYKIFNENKFIRQVISKDEIKILSEKDNIIYYFFKDSLYKYNPLKGSIKIFYNYESTFYSDNAIFIYNE